MKVTKLGHCCMLIEVDSLRILTDPGPWSGFKQNELSNIDIILITHEHSDHLHLESLQIVLTNNPKAQVITNSGVGYTLTEAKIAFEKMENGEQNAFDGIVISGHGLMHQEIYGEFGMVQNTGYLIGEKFFYPGDAFTNPNKAVELLALPVSGPWMQSKEAINYAKELQPKFILPVHDGMLAFPGPFHNVPKNVLGEKFKFLTQDSLQQNLTIEI